MRLLSIIAILSLSSCIGPLHLTDNAFYDVEDISIRLVFQHANDTLYKTEYEKNHNLPGRYISKLETTQNLDTTHRVGIALRFWTRTVLNEKSTFYGAYAKKGLLNKIQDIEIAFSNANVKQIITHMLKGDSSFTSFLWQKYDSNKSSHGYYVTPNQGYKNPYFKDIENWKVILNNKADTLERLDHYDYIFWLDTEEIRKLSFKPNTLTVRLLLIDSTSTKPKQVTDLINLKNNTH
jgi:hypothetical protein